MRRRRKKIDDHENYERWLLTYADMITLLLALFIVMYSVSAVDARKFGKISEALNTVLKGGSSILRHDEVSDKTGHGWMKLGDLRVFQQKIEERFNTLGKDEHLQTEVTERGLVIHIVESSLFDEGSADLKARAMEVLDMVAEELKGLPNHIRIEGHTDDRPISTPQYPSNWELSSARATSVVRYLVDYHDIPQDRISALGYGEYRPVKPNNSIENRAMNRRVDIVVLTTELSMTEPEAQNYETDENAPSEALSEIEAPDPALQAESTEQ